MDTLEFIFKKVADRLVNETDDELRQYQRLLEQEIKKGGNKAKEKQALKEVRKALGYSTEEVVEVVETKRPKDDYETRQKKRKELIKKQFDEAIADHFNS